MALSAARKVLQMGDPTTVLPSSLDVKVKANAKLYVGGLVGIDSTGYGVAGAASAMFLAGWAFGKAGFPQVYDATGLSSGDLVAKVENGVGVFHVGGSGDALAQADYGSPVWVIDDQTVGKTDGGATARPLAGIFLGFAPNGTDAFVLVSAMVNAAIIAAKAVAQQATSVGAIAAAGAVPLNDLVLATVTGTTAYTLADGTKLGQRVTVTVLSGSGTPVGTITPTTPRGFANVTALGAIGDTVTFQWTATGWVIVSANGVTVA